MLLDHGLPPSIFARMDIFTGFHVQFKEVVAYSQHPVKSRGKFDLLPSLTFPFDNLLT